MLSSVQISLRILGTIIIGLLFIFNELIAQPGPLDSYTFEISAGTVGLPTYTAFSVPFYPYDGNVQKDSVGFILGTQLTLGSLATADRVLDVTAGGYAYRNASGQWTGTMNLLRNKRAFYIANRHESREITVTGFPLDTITYISPMPSGTVRTAGPRQLMTHEIDSVGLIFYGFHKSQTMRLGGDIIIDLVTGHIARCDSAAGWIGSLDSLYLGHPVMIQVNHSATFDWTYHPGRP